jgi:hypothetical protein
MKKGLVFCGAPVMVLVLGILFAACEDAQKVDIVYSKANAVSAVVAVKTTDGRYIIINWPAAENVASYQLFLQQEGKQTILSGGGYAQNFYTYSADDGAETKNDDFDKWSAKIMASTQYSGKKFRFGIQTEELVKSGSSLASDVVWSGYVEF